MQSRSLSEAPTRIEIATAISNPRPSTVVAAGVDLDVNIRIREGCPYGCDERADRDSRCDSCNASIWNGEITLVPDGRTGALVPCGPSADYWCDDSVRKALREITRRAPHALDEVIETLAGGEGLETIEVAL